MNESHADACRTLRRLTPSLPLRLALLVFMAMLAFAATFIPNQGAQAQIMKPVGASGNTQSPDKCPGSTFLVGFMVRYGDWLNAIGIICAPVDGNGRTGAQVPQPPKLRGGTGGSPPTPVTCPVNEVAVGVLIHLQSGGRRVRGIGLDCKGADAQGLQRQGLGRIVDLGHNDTPAISQLCVPNNAISEVDINWGDDVNGVGVTCTMVHQPPPSTATLAPGQTQQGPFGGPGGGPFQITCNPGDEVVGFDTMQQNGVLVGIAPVCGRRQTSPTDTNGRPSAGTSTGPWNKLRCEPNAVVTILDVFVGNLPFVSTIGFTCWNPTASKVTNSYPDAGSPKVSDQHLVCPSGQIAVGIFGRAGTAIDQVGVICDKWVAAVLPPVVTQSSLPTTPDQTAILGVQNNYRQACGVPPLKWDPVLVAAAQKWVNNCSQEQGTDSNGNTAMFACHENDAGCPKGGPNTSPYGENLSFGWPTMTGNNAALFWICEWKNYMVNGAAPSNPTFVGGDYTSTPTDPCPVVNGHFTEVVWRPTGSVGCASNTCTINGVSGTLWSCKYNPKGNVSVDPKSVPGLTVAQAQINLKANVPSTCPAPPPTPNVQHH